MGYRRRLQRRGAGLAILAALIATLAFGTGAASASTPAAPAASYTFAPAKPLVGEPIVFESTATPGSSPIFWQSWDFDGTGRSDAFGPTATHTYTSPGVHTVKLFVLSWDGRFDTATEQIEVFDPPTAAFGVSPAKPGAGRPVTLSSTSSAATGLTLSTQKWDLDDDGQYDDATGASATKTFSTPGTYAVGLEVTDSKGITDTTTRTITVYAPPTAAFGSTPAAPVPNQPMTFTSSSSDSDGTIVSQLWDTDGDGQYDDGSGATLTKSFAAGHQTVALQVTDSQGLVTTTSRSFEVVPAPTAAFGVAPAQPGAGSPTTFTSSSAAASGFTLTSQQWDLDNDGQYDDATGPSATRTFVTPGDYTVGIQATDSRGVTSTLRRSVKVFAPPTAAFAFTPATPVPNQQMMFSSSSADSDGTIVSELWDVDGDGFDDGSGATLTKSFAAGHYTVRLEVKDSQNLVTTVSKSFDVVPAPTAAFTAAPQSPVVGTAIALTSNAAAASGYTLTSQKWDLDGDGQYDDATGATATKAFTTAGDHTVGLEVTDNRGVVSTSRRAVVVYVPPTAGFDFTPATPLAGDDVTFESTSTDPDGTIADASWDLDGDGRFGDAGGDTVKHAFGEGRHTVALRVTDSQGLTDTVEHDVVVAARPVANAPSKPVSFDTTTVTPPTPQGGILDWLSPFPVVRIAGVARRHSTRIRVFSVLTPLGATVNAHCSSRKCGRRPLKTHWLGTKPAKVLRLHAFERTLPARTRLTVSITRVGFVGKYTRFVLRARRAPRRTDRCYVPGNDQPVKCPKKP
jgi:PKD repeat protein